jgi:hypothetical protein
MYPNKTGSIVLRRRCGNMESIFLLPSADPCSPPATASRALSRAAWEWPRADALAGHCEGASAAAAYVGKGVDASALFGRVGHVTAVASWI